MSAIGGGSIGALNLAGSVAGAQRNQATADQSRAEASGKAFQVDAARMSAQLNGDVSEPELSSDRDADGRLPYEEAAGHPEREPDQPEGEPVRRSADATGVLGNALDLEA